MKAGEWVSLNEAGGLNFPASKGREGRIVFVRRERAWVNWLRHGTDGPYPIAFLTVHTELTPLLAGKFSHVEITDD